MALNDTDEDLREAAERIWAAVEYGRGGVRAVKQFLDESALTEAALRELIKNAIGYDLVPLSIRNHPEITFEFRTAADRDGLVDRISTALLGRV